MFLQYIRFALVGLLNTATDFAILNLLLFAFGPEVRKPWYVAFKTASFLGAVAQSYFLNKYWVFHRPGAASGAGKRSASPKRETGMFLAVSAAGFAINIAGSLAVFALLGRVGAFDPRIDANIGALAGAGLTQVSNFLGYKFLVFKKNNESHTPVGSIAGIQGIKKDRGDAS